MTTGPTLPPQAYTREILAIAFQWLQNQPESIKKLAQSPDALVGLYLRAQRYGPASPEVDAPVTSQNFVNDLKNLAEGLKQFEDPKPEGHLGATAFAFSHPSLGPAPSLPLNPPLNHSVNHSVNHAAPQVSQGPGTPAPTPASQTSRPRPQMNGATPPVSQPSPASYSTSTSPVLSGHLNANAQAMIHEVKSQLNLSSDTEVLNMMVALAYKSVKNLLT